MSRSKKYKFLRAPSIVSDHLDHLGTFLISTYSGSSVDLRTINTETYGTRDEYDVIDFPLRFAVCVSIFAAFAIGASAYTGR